MYEVKVEGLRAFVAALEAVDAKFPETIREANKGVADGIKDKAIRLAASHPARHGGQSVMARVSGSIRASGQSAAAVVKMGRGHPEWQGAEWGAKRYRQFNYWRGNQWRYWDGGPGYIIHPTIRDHAPELIEEYARKMDELYRIAFPE